MATNYRIIVKSWDRHYGEGHVVAKSQISVARRGAKHDAAAIAKLDELVRLHPPKGREATAYVEVSEPRFTAQVIARYSGETGEWLQPGQAPTPKPAPPPRPRTNLIAPEEGARFRNRRTGSIYAVQRLDQRMHPGSFLLRHTQPIYESEKRVIDYSGEHDTQESFDQRYEPVSAPESPPDMQPNSRGPKRLELDSTHEARLLGIGRNDTLHAPTETWAVYPTGKLGSTVLQVTLWLKHGQWSAWTGSYTRAAQRELAYQLEAARNSHPTENLTENPNSRGLYHRTAAQPDDFAVHSHRGRYYVDHVRRGGTHVTIGTTRGFATIAEAQEAIAAYAHTLGIQPGTIFEQREDDLHPLTENPRRPDRRYQTREVLAGAYRGRSVSDRTLLSHLVDTEDPQERAMCGRVKPDQIADEYSRVESERYARPSCPACAKKWDKLVGDTDLTENPRLTRAELERLVWSKTPADYRSTTGGTRKVLTLTAQGTTLVPLSELTDWQLRQLLGKPALSAAGDFAANARRGAADETAARELCLYIENDSKLMGPNSQGKAIEKNLLSKVQRGTFDKDRSVAAWMYLMETGAKAYATEFADSPSEWSVLFTPATRELAAHYFAEKFADEIPYRR